MSTQHYQNYPGFTKSFSERDALTATMFVLKETECTSENIPPPPRQPQKGKPPTTTNIPLPGPPRLSTSRAFNNSLPGTTLGPGVCRLSWSMVLLTDTVPYHVLQEPDQP